MNKEKKGQGADWGVDEKDGESDEKSRNFEGRWDRRWVEGVEWAGADDVLTVLVEPTKFPETKVTLRVYN